MDKKSLKGNLLEKLYILFFIMIMFSGSTFLEGIVMQIVLILIFILFLLTRIRGIKKLGVIPKKTSLQKIIMLLIIIFLVYQLSISYNRSITLVFVERFIAFFFLLLYVPKAELSYKTIKAMRIYAFPVALSIILSTLVTGYKAGGLVGNFQFAGMMMSITFGIFLIDYYFEKKTSNLIGMILSFLGLMMSGKRMFTFMAIIAYLLIYLISNEKSKKKKFISLSVFLLIGLILAYSLIPAVRLIVERIISFSGDTTYNGRSYFWEASFDIFHKNIFSGIGMGCFSSYFDIFYHRLGNMEAYDAHNIYIQMLAELGLIGFTLFIFFFISNLLKSIKVLKSKKIRNSKIDMYVLCYSIYLQIWFIMYGFTGNPLYGANQTFFYFSSVAMLLALHNKVVEGEISNETKIM